MFSAARRRRLVNSTFSLIELFFSPERLYREHRDAFELPVEIFRKQYRLPKIVVRWLCDELREEPEVRRVRTSWTVMTVELQVLCALRFYGTGSFQGMVASDEHVARDQKTVSVAVRAVSVAIVRRLGVQRGWIHFPETPSERFDAEKGFRLLGRIPGVIGCVDGTMVSIVGPSKNDPTVTKAAYWCRKYFYALNVMVVCDADCRIMCIDPRYPGSVHDSFVWQFSWLRNQLEQGQLPRDGRFLLGDSGYPLEPWLITPVPGNHATSTACGRFNKAHSSISAPQHLPCIERARTGVRLRP
ncbi:putative nuclease HARBI1 isoform X1 [Ixodes scapularis]